jgi:hypothetical protein
MVLDYMQSSSAWHYERVQTQLPTKMPLKDSRGFLHGRPGPAPISGSVGRMLSNDVHCSHLMTIYTTNYKAINQRCRNASAESANPICSANDVL